MDAVDNRTEIRDFLATRRAKLTPAQVGLPAAGRRRVPGLRREEVAVLAGVSTDWYNRLEKGHISGVSDDVLDAVARALQLSEAEREHLFNLARAARPVRTPRRRARPQIPPSVQRVLDSMTGTAAFVRNGRLDILASNALGRALYSPVLDQPAHRGNIARFDFLDPRAGDYYPDHDGALATAVALLRTEAGRSPHDKDLTDLVGELATRSEAFRTRWGAHDVRLHRGRCGGPDLLLGVRDDRIGPQGRRSLCRRQARPRLFNKSLRCAGTACHRESARTAEGQLSTPRTTVS